MKKRLAARLPRPAETFVSLPARIRGARDVTAALAALNLLLTVLIGFVQWPIDLATVAPTTVHSMLPDGSIAVVCRTDLSSDKPLPHGAAPHCDACLITAAPGLPVEPPAAPVPVFATLRIDERQGSRRAIGGPETSLRARGPPALMTIG